MEWPGKEEVFNQGTFMMTRNEGGGEHLVGLLAGLMNGGKIMKHLQYDRSGGLM